MQFCAQVSKSLHGQSSVGTGSWLFAVFLIHLPSCFLQSELAFSCTLVSLKFPFIILLVSLWLFGRFLDSGIPKFRTPNPRKVVFQFLATLVQFGDCSV